MKQFVVEIDKLVVDAAGIAPMHGEQFRALVEQVLEQRLENYGVPSRVAAKENVSIAVPEVRTDGNAYGMRLARHVGQAIHQSLTRRA